MTQLIAGKFRGDELATHRLKPVRTPIQQGPFAERLESKCGALAGRPLKINIDRPATSELFKNPVYPAKSKQAPSACFCWRNGREVSGRRIGYSQAKACSYADPAGPLYRVQAERQKLRCSIFLFCAKPSASTVRTKQKNLCLSKGFCRNRLVGETGFEPATSNSRSWRANRTALHPERTPGISEIAQRYAENPKRPNKFLKKRRRRTYSLL